MWHVCLPGYHILHGAHCALDLKSIAIQFINELWDDTTCTYMYIALMRIQKNEEGLERTYGPFTVRAFLPAWHCLPAQTSGSREGPSDIHPYVRIPNAYLIVT